MWEKFKPTIKTSGFQNVSMYGDGYHLSTHFPFQKTHFDFTPRNLGIQPYSIKKVHYPYDHLLTSKIQPISVKEMHYENPCLDKLHTENIKVTQKELDQGPFAPHFQSQTKDVVVPNEALYEYGIQETTPKDFMKANFQEESDTVNPLATRRAHDNFEINPSPFHQEYGNFLKSKNENEQIDKWIQQINEFDNSGDTKVFDELQNKLPKEVKVNPLKKMKVGEITQFLEKQKTKNLPPERGAAATPPAPPITPAKKIRKTFDSSMLSSPLPTPPSNDRQSQRKQRSSEQMELIRRANEALSDNTPKGKSPREANEEIIKRLEEEERVEHADLGGLDVTAQTKLKNIHKKYGMALQNRLTEEFAMKYPNKYDENDTWKDFKAKFRI